MIKKLVVYDWKIIAQDDDFRKYKKVFLLELIMEEFPYQLGTVINFGNNHEARFNRTYVDLVNNIEYYEAVATTKWVM